MRIAVPTKDKISVSNDPRGALFFKVITFRGSDIVEEEFRKCPLSGINSTAQLSNREVDCVATILADCDVLVGPNSEDMSGFFRINNYINTASTRQKIITTAAIEYNRNYCRQESNTCCSP